MSKRFPVPEFNRDELKNLEWSAPLPLSADEQQSRIAALRAGDASACGGFVVQASDALYDKLGFRGPHRCVVMCLTPPGSDVTVLGRSYAWAIQRALVVDSLDPAAAGVVLDWRTPRAMNTRLGPDNGVVVPGGVMYALIGNRYAGHWLGNRVIVDNAHGAGPGTPGFRILSAYDDQADDFHACNLSFSW